MYPRMRWSAAIPLACFARTSTGWPSRGDQPTSCSTRPGRRPGWSEADLGELCGFDGDCRDAGVAEGCRPGKCPDVGGLLPAVGCSVFGVRVHPTGASTWSTVRSIERNVTWPVGGVTRVTDG